MALNGKVVLIFGGSSGIGKAVAISVLEQSGTPWIISRTLSKLQAVADEISPEDTTRVRIAALDCMNEDAVRVFFEGLESGSFHHLVMTLGDAVDCNDIRGADGFAGLRRQMDAKFFAQVAPVSFGVDKMADGGCCVFFSGALSKRPGKGNTALACSNSVLEIMAKGLANDLGPRVRVNVVSPGLTDTDMWKSLAPEVWCMYVQ